MRLLLYQLNLLSSILAFSGTVVVLDRVRDVIGDMIMLASSFGSVVCVVFCCLVLSRVCDEIDVQLVRFIPSTAVYALFSVACVMVCHISMSSSAA